MYKTDFPEKTKQEKFCWQMAMLMGLLGVVGYVLTRSFTLLISCTTLHLVFYVAYLQSRLYNITVHLTRRIAMTEILIGKVRVTS